MERKQTRHKLPISQRLLNCAALVPQGARVADIGADHGYLSIELLRQGIASYVHASELREKPLQRAIENAGKFGVADKMRFSQADGLDAIAPDEVDTVICAGMGGDLITGIIERCPWIQNPRYLLILQPQSSGNDLRRRLAELGFSIAQETLAQDSGFLYNILCLRYAHPQHLTPGQQYLSPQLLESGSPLLPQYIQRIIHALELTVEGIRRSNDPAAADKLGYYKTALAEVREMAKSL